MGAPALPAVVTRATPAVTAAALTGTLGLAAASWVVAVRQMHGMDMGAATRLGSFAFFIGVWVVMMAAMMLPGAVPAVLRRAQASHGVAAVPLSAGVYEFTPLKRHFRRRCRDRVRSGFRFGLCCAGSSIGLMAMLLALGVMSVTWMSVTAILALAQKLLPPKAAVDVSLALAITGLGVWIILAPSSVPGLMPSM